MTRTDQIEFDISKFQTQAVFTVSGDSVTIVAYRPELRKPVIGIHQGEVRSWARDGRFHVYSSSDSRGLDLVMQGKPLVPQITQFVIQAYAVARKRGAEGTLGANEVAAFALEEFAKRGITYPFTEATASGQEEAA